MNVITFGTFDIFHIGHLNMLKKCKKLCGGNGKLYVGLESDEISQKRNKHNYMCYKDRFKILKSIRYVDYVFKQNIFYVGRPISAFNHYILKYKIDILCMSDEYKNKLDFTNKCCKIVLIKRTQNISSSIIKKDWII